MRSIQESIRIMIQEHKLKKHLIAPVSMIAIATVFVVVWSLHINGITMTSADLICGMEEHVHTDDCYAWVVMESDGTELEPTEGTEGTEEPEEGSEAIDATEGTEATDGAEGIEVSGSTETGDGAEETEAVAEQPTEDATEELTELASEELTETVTEEVTEEATGAPQLGDTKVANGVTYVYTLVCETEQHVHTDACYKSAVTINTETLIADAEESSETTASTDSEDGESGDGDADGSTSGDESERMDSEDGLDETAENNEIVTSTTTRLGSSNSSDDDDEESGIATISEEDNSSNTLTSTASEGSYYFADTTTLADAADSDDYIIYTIDDEGKYYLVKSDGSLYACSDLTASYSSDTDKATASDSDGAYYWETSSGVDTFKLTSLSSLSLDDYLWTVTGTGTSDSNGNNGYTLYNSSSQNYLAPGEGENGSTLSGSDWWTATTGYNIWSDPYTISDGKALIFTVYCSEQIKDNGIFTLMLSNGTNIIYTHSYGSGDISPHDDDSNPTTYGDETLTYSVLNSGFNAVAGSTYTVIVEREANADDATLSDYTITYYDENGDAFLIFEATKTPLSGDDVYANFIAQYGSYNVSVAYATKVDKDDSITGIAGTYSSITVDTYDDQTGSWSVLDETQITGDETLSGDFDVTYGFNNSNTSRNSSLTGESYDKDWNYVFVLKIGDDTTAYFYASSGITDSTINTTLADVTLSNNYTAYYGINNMWSIYMAQGANCTLQVVREGNSITITANMTHNSTGNAIATCETTISSDSFANCDIEMYLTAIGSTCTLSDITLVDNTPDYKVYDYDAFSPCTTDEETVYLTASNTTGWTAYTDVYTSEPSLTKESDNSSVSWTAGATGVTYYFAKLRSFTAYFDGTNGSVSYYNRYYGSNGYNSSYIVTSYSMDKTGTYVILDTSNVTQTNTGRYSYTANGWYDLYFGTYYSNSEISAGSIEYEYGKNNSCTVLYADWAATSYVGYDSTETPIESLDTSSFITTYMFDYNDDYDKIALN